jgi:rhodanese-related sulfurtransferase/polyisoprenoid-binding protein YceI
MPASAPDSTRDYLVQPLLAMSVQIDPSDLAQRLEESQAPVLVDVRLEDDYAAAHLPEARNNCVFEIAFLDRMADVAPDRRAAVCVYGATVDSCEARMAAEKLCRAGYTDVLELREGLEGWKSAGLPLEGAGTQSALEAAPPDGWREIDAAESRVEWLGRNLLNKHYGQIALKSGELRFDRGQLVTGEFTLDMRAIKCQDLEGDPLHDVLIAHLMSHDFFDVDLYPEARFVIIATEPVAGATPGAPNLAVRGELTLKNVSRAVNFVATSGLTTEGKPAAQSAFPIDRTQWNVLYGSGKYFRHLGGHLINDLIEIQIRVVTK